MEIKVLALPIRTFNMRMTVKKKNIIIMRWKPTSSFVNPLLTGSYMPPYGIFSQDEQAKKKIKKKK
jgi:hypothetical protein